MTVRHRWPLSLRMEAFCSAPIPVTTTRRGISCDLTPIITALVRAATTTPYVRRTALPVSPLHGNNISSDGNLYAIGQGAVLEEKIFQQLAIGAAYTTASLGGYGKIYTQNDGHLFVVGQ
jgi:hypothetical protein